MDTLLGLIEDIKKSGSLILVEGKKDRKALEKIGIPPKMIYEMTGKYIEKAVEELRDEKEVLILTDLDPRGRKLYSRLDHYFSQIGVKVDNTFRNFLFKETNLRQIEGIATYINNHKNA